MGNEIDKGPIELAVEARGRRYHRFPVNGFLGLGDKPILEFDVCVPTDQEMDNSVSAARSYVIDKCKDDPGALNDPDILTNAKIIEILWRTTRQPLREDKGPVPDCGPVHYPAFMGGSEWMRKHLTRDQLAVMRNLLDLVEANESPLTREIDYEKVEILARLCWAAKDTDLPEAVLVNRSYDYLAQAFTLLAIRYAKAVGWDKTPETEPGDGPPVAVPPDADHA